MISTLLSLVGRLALRTAGWRYVHEAPHILRAVVIGAPHTSNWDFPFTVLVAWSLNVRFRWLGKHSLFDFPFGTFFRVLGGIPVVRHERKDMVSFAASHFEKYDQLVLLIAAEGTRKRVEYWKSGFYHIALKAKVPLLLGYFDYKNKVAGFGPVFYPTGDIKADMDHLRAFYSGIVGDVPENFGPVRLREEVPVEVEAPAEASLQTSGENKLERSSR